MVAEQVDKPFGQNAEFGGEETWVASAAAVHSRACCHVFKSSNLITFTACSSLLIRFRQAAALGRLARSSPKPICWLRKHPQPVMSTPPTTDN